MGALLRTGQTNARRPAPRRNVEHREICDAIVDRDAERAARLMREHLEDGARLSLGMAD
jgi:DNA-binding GntR family transcriptional regulator